MLYLRYALLSLIALGAVLFLAQQAGSAPAVSEVTPASISAGGDHTCAVTVAGGAKCWGSSWSGKLGDGQSCGYLPSDCTTMVNVYGLTSGVVAAVAAGGNHTCGLTVAGGVKCWGNNTYGQLGDGQGCGTNCTTPVDVSGLPSGVAAVAAGDNHTCALTTVGGVKCWGTNTYGQLGDGRGCGYTRCTTPVDVSGLTSGVAAIAAGGGGYLLGGHTCALTTAGGVKCWGDNSSGQLGDGQSCGTECTTPVDVSGLTSGAAAVTAGGFHTCALTTVGGVKCWGNNYYGQLGDGQSCGTECTIPVDVFGLTSGVVAVAAGDGHTCALTTAGGLTCWGRNYAGQLGDGQSCGTVCTTPVDVFGLTSGVAAVTAGDSHTCAVTTADDPKCWGWNFYGQLGDGQSCGTKCTTPVDVLGFGPDSDGDGVGDNLDNCPSTSNPEQENADDDQWGNVCEPDDDDDSICDIGGPLPDGTPGTPAGGCIAGPQGVDNCPTVPNLDQTDTDSDVVGNVCDNCPDTANAGQENADGDRWGDACDYCPSTVTGWFTPVGDDDCDGFTTDDELYMGTDPDKACADTSMVNDEDGRDAWPFDFDDNQSPRIGEILAYIPMFNTFAPGPPYDPRFDLNADGWIGLIDVLSFIPVFHVRCTP